ncbi:putative transposase [Saccharopolyspora erythraea NRRL 2338]|uniref:Transposase n=2 Tax=Saccharopolyspora erythraea TaxID=1836 RepID=A4FIA0_SACEN|nr:RNA-guided endonuclease TnpB family protein [Saccharopolyspora erythraea]EQD82690.1 transposase IS605 [Saccharopolyspora erythraea D]PFG97453.1 putative transposase [Saccharopolyspora erythraea NRRL 2338]QRK87632.1 transposase [Saccharopolyspora erythraea]CAM03775.1 putative transposase [Saccharopolyspora erythraea NRRL 2338]
MQLRYRYRLYPTPGQKQALARAFGCARVVYNDTVAARRAAHANGDKYPSGTVLQKRLITDAKKTNERAWLTDAAAQMLQQAIRDCDQAYKNFFDSLKGRRGGRRMGAPRFKSRKDARQAIRFTRGAFSAVTDGKLTLAKIGDIKVAWSRDLPSVPSSCTVIKTADERFFASFVVEVGDETLEPVDAETGIDLGLSAFAVDDQGRIIDNPRFLRRAERKLKRLQRAVSRKQKGSNNRNKARKKLARQHAKVRDTRLDWLHKTTTTLIRENQAVYVEDLAVSGLARTRLAKSVHDASWGTFRRLLEEKAARYGRDLVVIDRWLPTSQTCFACGRIDGPKPLSVRTWSCSCGTHHDRDQNAARNILAAGRAERLNACGGDVRPRTGAVAAEAGTPEAPHKRSRNLPSRQERTSKQRTIAGRRVVSGAVVVLGCGR